MWPSARFLAAVITGSVVVAALILGAGGWPGAGDQATLLLNNLDCEAIGTGLVRQPVTAWTSLAFSAVGIWAAGDRRLTPPGARLVVAASLVAVGLGSFVAHASFTDWARQADSGAIKLMLLAFIVYPVGRARTWDSRAILAAWSGTGAAVVVVELAWPAGARLLLVVLALAAISGAWTITTPSARTRLIGGLLLLGVGGAAWWLGRAGGPLCAPWSLFQVHAAWHILSAAGIAAIYQVYRSEPI